MLRKKVIPMVLAGCLATVILPTSYHAWADTYTLGASSSSYDTASIDIPAIGEIIVTDAETAEPDSIDLEKIILAVKGKITIPAAYTQFNYNFSTDSYQSGAVWTLNWRTEDNSKYIYVTSDQEGNILSYNHQEAFSLSAPKYLKTELKGTADAFIQKVAPDIAGKLQYISAQSQSRYGNSYSFKYERIENGILMPDNSVTVTVNYGTGKVTGFQANWLYGAEIPSAETKITKSQAMDIIGKNVKMKLTYKNFYTEDSGGKAAIKAFLVYEPDNSYIAVDAKTGEVYTTQNEWIAFGDKNSENESAADAATGSDGLTKEEITKIDEIKGLVSKEAAIEAITGNKSLLLDDNLSSITANLYKQNSYYGQGSDNYVWSISLRDPREVKENSTDTYRAYAYAEVDAKTGNILSFRSSVKTYYNSTTQEWEAVNMKYTLDQGQKVLEDFLKVQIPEIYRNTVFTNNDPAYVIYYKDNQAVYGGYSYNYERVNEGINYSYNGINGSVDGVTGKIYAFSYNWNDNITFESPKGAMSAESAFNSYIANEGFRLVYEINNIHKYSDSAAAYTGSYSVSSEVRLVYRTDISPVQISPFTGKQLDSEGNEYAKEENLYNYTDIGSSAHAKSIKLLAELGIGFKGGEFKPAQAITASEFTNILENAGIYYNSSKYQLSSTSSAVSRIAVSKFAVQVLGYENVATIKGIYNVTFKDQDKISEADLGYAALAQGLGLVTINSDDQFRPADNLTRGEAADLVIAILGIQK